MTRSVATAVENNFVKGLITEATGLQYPENSLVEIDNCVIDTLGAIERRLGVDLERLYDTITEDISGSAIVNYLWRNATGDGTQSFLVVQIGAKLNFYNITQGTASVSSRHMTSTIDLTPLQMAGTDEIRLSECQFADGLSKLFVVHPSLRNFYVTYDPGPETFTATEYTLQVRDFEGLPETIDVDGRPGTLTDTHKYNLLNQGWDETKITAWNTSQSNYPSNADVWWIFKDASDTFDPATQANNSRGNTPAPKGHFILDLYADDRSTPSGIAGIPANPATKATSAVAFFAGRVWYSGIQSVGYTSKLYFSQIIVEDDQVGKCYQKSDPTSETLFDFLPDDGGVIVIPGAGAIYRIIPVGNSLFVFAFNGVYQITGSTGLGFTATDYVVADMPGSVRTDSASSFVVVNGLPLWWNPDGIYGVSQAQGGGFVVQSLTKTTIQSFYDEIPNRGKTSVRGAYNTVSRVVSWLYHTSAPSSIDEHYEYDAVLNLNVTTGAFYGWTFSEGAKVHSIACLDSLGGAIIEDIIVDEAGDTVVSESGAIVTGYSLTNVSFGPRLKFFVSFEDTGTKLTFAEANDATYMDWSSLSAPVDYDSYFITGYKLHAQANKNFQSNYATIYNEGLGVVYFQGVWDFATSGSTGRYTVRQLVSFSKPDFGTNSRRLKVRGSGKALQYKIQSLPGQSFRIVGWSTWETGNTKP